MKGDFSRDTFDPDKHFLRVLQQQGRVQLDADWNEQVSILLHHLQSMAQESIGPHGSSNGGFQILDKDGTNPLKNDFRIRAGRYYVQGMLCENSRDTPLSKLPPHPDGTPANNGTYLVYLDVWERHISYIEDDSIREKALNGADTANRSELVWQIRLKGLDGMTAADAVKNYKDDANAYRNFKDKINVVPPGQLKADVKKNGHVPTEPCLISPDARYHGPQNQLYRVEIHKSGGADVATWKWSRDNGSITFPMAKKIETDGNSTTITLENFGRDGYPNLKVDDRVEVVDDDYVRTFAFSNLLRIKELREDEGQVILEGTPGGEVGKWMKKHPLLRRWDHKPPTAVPVAGDGAITVQENKVFQLEEGIQVMFGPDPAAPNSPRRYEVGSYWLIPARVATGGIEWETQDVDGITVGKWLPPKGIQHYYAPLAHLKVANDGVVTATDLRHQTGTGPTQDAKNVTISLTPNLVPTSDNAWGYSSKGYYANKKNGAMIANGMMSVSLPDGAVIKSLRITGANRGDGNFVVTLNRQAVTVDPNDLDEFEELLKAKAPNGLSFDTLKLSDPNAQNVIVNNANYRYFLVVDLKGAGANDVVTLHAIQIEITLPA